MEIFVGKINKKIKINKSGLITTKKRKGTIEARNPALQT